jgi:8-oxo-dGTP diphosphatase
MLGGFISYSSGFFVRWYSFVMETTNPRPKVGVGVLIIKNGKVLLGKRKGAHGAGEYAGMGGHVEFHEKLEDTVKREAFEEAGVTLKNIKYPCTSNLRKYEKHYLDIGFTAEIESGEPQVMEPEKLESWNWYDLDHLPSPLFGVLPYYIEAYKTGKTFFEE